MNATCYDCVQHLFAFDENGVHDYCQAKGAFVNENFASQNHFCCELEQEYQENLTHSGRS
jgi:hypothetical protein